LVEALDTSQDWWGEVRASSIALAFAEFGSRGRSPHQPGMQKPRSAHPHAGGASVLASCGCHASPARADARPTRPCATRGQFFQL